MTSSLKHQAPTKSPSCLDQNRSKFPLKWPSQKTCSKLIYLARTLKDVVLFSWIGWRWLLFLCHKNVPFSFAQPFNKNPIKALKDRGDSHEKGLILTYTKDKIKCRDCHLTMTSSWHHALHHHDINMTSSMISCGPTTWHHRWHHHDTCHLVTIYIWQVSYKSVQRISRQHIPCICIHTSFILV